MQRHEWFSRLAKDLRELTKEEELGDSELQYFWHVYDSTHQHEIHLSHFEVTPDRDDPKRIVSLMVQIGLSLSIFICWCTVLDSVFVKYTVGDTEIYIRPSDQALALGIFHDAPNTINTIENPPPRK